jgi:hypothetical protein
MCDLFLIHYREFFSILIYYTMSILNDSETIKRTINSYFPTELFETNVENNAQKVHIFVENREEPTQKCIELIVNKSVANVLLIKDLQKCNTMDNVNVGNGKYLLESIEQIAHDLDVSELMIDMDSSSLYIKCNEKTYDFSLKHLYLFSSGNTWYGKYGFRLKYKSDVFLDSVREFINQPFADDTQSSFRQFFAPKKTTTVKDYFTHMLTDINRLTRDKKCIHSKDESVLGNYHRVLKQYIRLFDRFVSINYDGPYIKYIGIHETAGKKKRFHKMLKTRKRKNKKIRGKHNKSKKI